MTRRLAIDGATGSAEVACVWCDRATTPWATRTVQGSVYVCTCGARVLFAPPHDFDEAAEELLDHLGIAGDVCEPAQSVGTSGMLSVRHHDGAASRRQLAAALTAAGNETRPEDAEVVFAPPVAWRTATLWGLWWRPARPPS